MKLKFGKRLFVVCAVVLGYILSSKTVHAETFDLTYSSEGITTTVTYSVNEDNSTVAITDCSSIADKNVGIRIPETVTNNGVTYTVTSLGEYAFSNENNLVLVEIPGTVKKIGEKCFDSCYYLQQVIFSEDGLEYIGDRAFFHCALSSFQIPSTVTTIEECAFGYATFSEITIPKSVTTWGDSIFYSSSYLKTVTFEEGCTVVPPRMFAGCKAITTVKFPNTIKSIEERAFSHGGTIEELVLPVSLQRIGESAFYTTTIKKLVANCDNVQLDTNAMYGADVETVYCAKDSTFYKKYYGSYNTNIVRTDTYMQDEKINLKFGESYQLSVTNPVGTTSWASSDSNIVTVSENGLIVGVGSGNAIVTAVNNGVSMTCAVTVGEFKLNKTKITVGVASTFQLKATDGIEVQWKSSNSKIATVNAEGVVKAKKKGKVNITATAAGTTVTCKITIKNNERSKLESYSKKPSAYEKNIAGFGFSKIKRDSKGNYIITGHFLNNFGQSGSYLKNLTITVYKDGKKIAKQKYAKFKVKAPAYSMKPVTIKIKKSKITKKTTDLRNGKITIKVSGGTLYR
ncbi:MAG: leucine-rich repeat protein [Lachnospiraceae bacterium]|nr:leucine-rich repeat protein [Lachnospiraceae bacterium]